MLHPFTPDHFDYIIRWVDTPELMERYSGPDFEWPWTREVLQEYIDTVHDRDRFMYSKEGTMLGYGEVLYNGEFQPRLGRLLIGPQAHRGKGHGAQMIRELVAYAKRQNPKERVYLYVYTDNAPAIHSYEGVGFHYTHDHPLPVPNMPHKKVRLMHLD